MCVPAFTCVYMGIQMCIHAFTHVWVYKCVYMFSHVYGCTNICTCFYMYVGLQMCVCMWGPEADVGNHPVSFLAHLLRLSLSQTQSLLMLLVLGASLLWGSHFCLPWLKFQASSHPPGNYVGFWGPDCDPDSCVASTLTAGLSAWCGLF